MLKYTFKLDNKSIKVYFNSDASYDVEEVETHRFEGTFELSISHLHFDDEKELDEYIDSLILFNEATDDVAELTEEIPF